MRRAVVFLGILGVSIMLCSCGQKENVKETVKENETTKEITHIGADGKVQSYDNLEALQDEAEVIVRVTRLNKEEPVVKKNEKGAILSAYTFSQVKVIEVYKDEGKEISSGEEITILENEAYDEESNMIYHVNGYNMMEENCEYLLFLRKSETDGKEYYVSLGVNYGTVSLSEDGRETVMKDSDGEKLADFSAYEEIWKDAKAKYAKKK